MTIQGDGVAAYCCAYLLNKAGFSIDLQAVARARLPVILLGDQALALIRDIFDQPGLFADAPRIRKRVVAWGPNTAPLEVEHSAILMSEAALLDGLRPVLAPGRDFDWTIYAARPLPAPVVEHPFGSRMASAVQVVLKEGSDAAACWIESLEDGWLFLVPGWLLAVGASAQKLLGGSRVIACEIAQIGANSGEFPAYARMVSPLNGSGWMACGTAAMAFDPICGDGTAHAIREAILAAAVIRAIHNEGSARELLSHYQARLTAGFQRHLMLCRQFYEAIRSSELEAIDRGIEWCGRELARHGTFRYQLRGFELEAVR